MADELGWMKFTQAFEPMEKLCQLRIAALELCVISMFEPEREIVALPATTVPPVGRVFAATSALARLA
jgi:hypothetical protein